jgi:hypothetical protein
MCGGPTNSVPPPALSHPHSHPLTLFPLGPRLATRGSHPHHHHSSESDARFGSTPHSEEGVVVVGSVCVVGKRGGMLGSAAMNGRMRGCVCECG